MKLLLTRVSTATAYRHPPEIEIRGVIPVTEGECLRVVEELENSLTKMKALVLVPEPIKYRGVPVPDALVPEAFKHGSISNDLEWSIRVAVAEQVLEAAPRCRSMADGSNLCVKPIGHEDETCSDGDRLSWKRKEAI